MNIGKALCESLRRHLADDHPPAIPEGGALLWKWFGDLSLARTWHAAGPNPITWSDIAAYRSIMAPAMEDRHAAILRRMDQVYLEHAHKPRNKPPENVKVLPRASRQVMTPALFDAIVG